MNILSPSLKDKQSLRSYINHIPNEVIQIGIVLCLLFAGIAILLLSGDLSHKSESNNEIIWEKQTDTAPTQEPNNEDQKHIYVDVSGAVQKPDMYKLPASTRLTQAVAEAGGLNEYADLAYYYRNFNLAKTLEDQEKIYVPSHLEIQIGLFAENSRLLQYFPTNQSDEGTDDTSDQQNSTTISVNTASLTELETLPGVGPVTAGKIIDNRPYTSIEELRDKNVIGPSTYTKIENLIGL